MSENAPRDSHNAFDITPEQYHAGLDKLWNALGITDVQHEDVFTLAAAKLEEHSTFVAQRDRLAAALRDILDHIQFDKTYEMTEQWHNARAALADLDTPDEKVTP